MFDSKHYVPCLKAKAGELAALRNLGPFARDYITPIVEVVPPNIPRQPRDPKKKRLRQTTIPELLQDLPGKLLSSWRSPSPFFLDTARLPLDSRMDDGTHPLRFLFDRWREKSLTLIPVTGSDRDEAYMSATRGVIDAGSQGLCVRLTPEDMFSSNPNAIVEQILSGAGSKAERGHLVLDLKVLQRNAASEMVDPLISGINGISNLGEWQSVTILAGSFPESLTGRGVGIIPIQRTEISLWKALIDRQDQLLRMPTFGDYGIETPLRLPPGMAGSASIRYTSEGKWLVFRGRSLKVPEYGQYEQFRSLCRLIVADPVYCGPELSYGDEYIQDCSTGAVDTGNLTTWKEIGTNHHITYTARQISKMFDSSGSF